MRLRTMLLLAAVGMAAPACGGDNGTGPDNGNDGDYPGSSQASVTGDVAHSFSGGAVFGTLSEGGTTAFAIALLRGTLGQNNSDAVYIGRDNNTAPAPGTYPIHSSTCTACTADDFTAAYLHQLTLADYGIFLSDTGSFTISSASADTLRGTFELIASKFVAFGSVAAADSVRLTGSFTAVAGPVPTAP